MGKQGTHSAKVGGWPPVFKKSAKEPKPNLLRCKKIIDIATFNFRTLNTITSDVSRAQYRYYMHTRTEILP